MCAWSLLGVSCLTRTTGEINSYRKKKENISDLVQRKPSISKSPALVQKTCLQSERIVVKPRQAIGRGSSINIQFNVKLACVTDQSLFNLAKFDNVLFPVFAFLCNFVLQTDCKTTSRASPYASFVL